MGLVSISDAIKYLIKSGVRADRGNPGSRMPHLVEPVVAVNVQESTHDKLTLIASVCGPLSKGASACEDLAMKVTTTWRALGAQVSWSDATFDGKSAMHILKVKGIWTAEETE